MGWLEIVRPQHPQVVLDQLGALLLDDQRPGAELRVVVRLVFLADRLDRFGLDPGLRRVVHPTWQVAVGPNDGRRGQEAWQSHQDSSGRIAMIALTPNPTPGRRRGQRGPIVHRACPWTVDGAD